MANPEHLRILKSRVERWNAWREENPDVEPDFTGANLRGLKLIGANLQNADFSGSDIRGTNFTEANAEGAKFANCKAGLRKRWIVVSIIASWIIGFLIWFVSALLIGETYTLIGRAIESIAMSPMPALQCILNTAMFLLIFIVFIVAIKEKAVFEEKAMTMRGAFAGIIISAAAWAVIGPDIGAVIEFVIKPAIDSVVKPMIEADPKTALLFKTYVDNIAESIHFIIVFYVLFLLAGGAVGIFLIFAVQLFVHSLVWVVASAMTVSMTIALCMAASVAWFTSARLLAKGVEGAWGGSIVFIMILVYYISWRVINEETTYSDIRKFCILLGSYFGTRFESAKLNETDFTSAILSGARFDDETEITLTCWKNAKKMHLVNFINTPLENKKIRDLLVNLDENKETEFSDIDLQGAYLVGANFRNTDFRNSCLDGADLSQADITGAKLFGVSRENWKIEGIKCEYIYWDVACKERMPIDRYFEIGEFEKIYKETPTFYYVFGEGFTPIEAFVMNETVEKIKKNNPDFGLNLASFKSHGTPNAKLTVRHRKNIKNALTAIKKQFEHRIKAIEGQRDKFMMELNRAISKVHYEKAQNAGSRIIRSIEFPPEYHSAGVAILSYFGTVLRKKYPDINAKIRIEQKDMKLIMVVEPINGKPELFEKALDEYGLVVTGHMTPDDFFPNDKLDAIALQNKLEITKLELQQTRRHLSLTEKAYGEKIKTLDDQVQWLRSCIGGMLQHSGNVLDKMESPKVDVKVYNVQSKKDAVLATDSATSQILKDELNSDTVTENKITNSR